MYFFLRKEEIMKNTDVIYVLFPSAERVIPYMTIVLLSEITSIMKLFNFRYTLKLSHSIAFRVLIIKEKVDHF